ncbi:MAG: hypothetical protein ACTHJR_12285 [Sphingomonas sp.]|uniref:hypothetical protein n=1 Tax=Sphingomonas sp. TaxID=28214 RepID=UPI003F7F962D
MTDKLIFGARFSDDATQWLNEKGEHVDNSAEGLEFEKFSTGNLTVTIGNRHESYMRTLSPWQQKLVYQFFTPTPSKPFFTDEVLTIKDTMQDDNLRTLAAEGVRLAKWIADGLPVTDDVRTGAQRIIDIWTDE